MNWAGVGGSLCRPPRIAGPGELHRRPRRRAFPPAVEVAAKVAAADSPHRITVPAHRVGDGAGDLGVVQADALGHPQHLPPDLPRRQGGDDGGGVAGGTYPAFGPVQPVGPAGQPVVDDEIGQRPGGVQGGPQRLGTALLGQRGRVETVGQARRGGPSTGGAQQLIGPQRRLPAAAVVVERDKNSALGQRAGTGVQGVAPCGTALTAAQVAALDTAAGPLAERGVLVAFDHDPGGRQAALRGYELLRSTGAWPTSASLPDGLDPAALAQQRGLEALRSALDNAPPLADLVVDDRLARWADRLHWAEGRVGAARDAAAVLATLPPEQVGRQVLRVAERVGLDHAEVTRAVTDAVSRDGDAVERVGRRDLRGDLDRGRECPPPGTAVW